VQQEAHDGFVQVVSVELTGVVFRVGLAVRVRQSVADGLPDFRASEVWLTG